MMGIFLARIVIPDAANGSGPKWPARRQAPPQSGIHIHGLPGMNSVPTFAVVMDSGLAAYSRAPE